MAGSVQAGLPPLPADTAGKWMIVDCTSKELIHRWLEVIWKTDRCMLAFRQHDFLGSPFHQSTPRGGAYYYWTPQFELSLAFAFHPQRRLHRVCGVGFTGTILPAAALDIVLDQCAAYLRERRQTAMLAIVPKRLDGAQVQNMLGQVPRHPRIKVTTEYETSLAIRWHIAFPELQGS